MDELELLPAYLREAIEAVALMDEDELPPVLEVVPVVDEEPTPPAPPVRKRGKARGFGKVGKGKGKGKRSPVAEVEPVPFPWTGGVFVRGGPRRVAG